MRRDHSILSGPKYQQILKQSVKVSRGDQVGGILGFPWVGLTQNTSQWENRMRLHRIHTSSFLHKIRLIDLTINRLARNMKWCSSFISILRMLFRRGKQIEERRKPTYNLSLGTGSLSIVIETSGLRMLAWKGFLFNW